MKNKKNTSTLSVPILTTLVFVVLKLCNVISWSWLWVLSPLWISTGLVIILVIILTAIERGVKS